MENQALGSRLSALRLCALGLSSTWSRITLGCPKASKPRAKSLEPESLLSEFIPERELHFARLCQ